MQIGIYRLTYHHPLIIITDYEIISENDQLFTFKIPIAFLIKQWYRYIQIDTY